MGIRTSLRSGTVERTVGAGATAAAVVVVVVVEVVRFCLPASAGAAHRRAASTAAMRAMGERMPLGSTDRPGGSILSFEELRQRADPAVLGLAQQAAQPEEIIHAANDRDHDHEVGQQVEPQG